MPTKWKKKENKNGKKQWKTIKKKKTIRWTARGKIKTNIKNTADEKVVSTMRQTIFKNSLVSHSVGVCVYFHFIYLFNFCSRFLFAFRIVVSFLCAISEAIWLWIEYEARKIFKDKFIL